LYNPSSWNFLGLDSFETSFEEAKFIIIPVPYDSTVSYRSGSRYGPHSILDASRNVELFDIELEDEPYKKGVFTLNEVEPVRGNVLETLDEIDRVTKDVIQRGKIPVVIGGEHTITVGAVKSLPRDVVVVDLDAHSDLRDSYQGDAFCHASTMRRILDQGKTVIEIGVRSMSLEEFQFIKEKNLPVFYREEIRRRTLRNVLTDIRRLIEGKKVYLSIDVDVLDPSEAPGVSTPEPDGLSFRDVQEITREVCYSSNVIGVDVVEVAPIPGSVVTEFLAAKLLYKTLGYIQEK
jgi:agmatinase